MARSFLWLLPGVVLVFFAACSDSEKPIAPNTISDVQLVNPRDSNFVADSLAPPPPKVWVEPLVEGLRVRFNGQFSETTPDEVSGIVDFEGYRVYISARYNVRNGYGLGASYDLEDYEKWVHILDAPGYVLMDCPYSLDSLRCLYGDPPEPCLDSGFLPGVYTPSRPYVHPDSPDSAFYFKPHDYNLDELGVETPIQRVYPDEPDPSTIPFPSLYPDHYTDDGYLKFYEYECIFRGMYPLRRFWVNVTAFDFGYPPLGIEPSETDYWSGAIGVYPLIRE